MNLTRRSSATSALDDGRIAGLSRTLPLLVAACLAGCGGEQGPPLRTVFVSAPVPYCAEGGAGEACDPFAGGSVPAALAGVDGDSLDAATLERLTGVEWRTVDVPAGPLFVDLSGVLGGESEAEERAAWIVEVVRVDAPEERFVAVGSHGGTSTWHDGTRLVRSRYPGRSVHRLGDVARVHLESGATPLLYRVLDPGGDWRLYREWWPIDGVEELLQLVAERGAWSDLPAARILPDGDTVLGLKEPRLRIGDATVVRFRWTTLLGEHLDETPYFSGAHPPSIPLPSGFDGTAVLETEVWAEEGGDLLYRESLAVFSESAVERLLPELLAVPAGGDPVHAARLQATRTFFGLEGDPVPASPWLRAHALGDLYRVVRDPDGYDRYSGAQVWGYRREWDGGVEPFWLAVPPGAEAGSDATPRPLVFSVNHATGPFFEARGAQPGYIIHPSTLASARGTFGVVPQVGGGHEIALFGARELPAITDALARRFPVDTARVGLVVWSQHAGEALLLALDPSVSLSHLAMAVPDVRIRDHGAVLDSLARLRPGLSLHLYAAAEDEVLPLRMLRGIADAARLSGITTEFVEVPHSTHLTGLLYDPEARLRRAMAPPVREAPSPDTTSSAGPT